MDEEISVIRYEKISRKVYWIKNGISIKIFETNIDERHLLLKRAFCHFGKYLHFFKWLTLIKQVLLYTGEIPLEVIHIIQSLFMFLSPEFIRYLASSNEVIPLINKDIFIDEEGHLCFHFLNANIDNNMDSNKLPLTRMNTLVDDDNHISITRDGNYNFIITPKRLYYQFCEDQDIDEDFDGLEIITKGGQFVTIISVQLHSKASFQNVFSMNMNYERDNHNVFNIVYIENESSLMFNEYLFEYGSYEKPFYPLMKEIIVKLPSYKTRDVKRLQNDPLKKGEKFIEVSKCEISEKYCEKCKKLFPLTMFSRGKNLVEFVFMENTCILCY
jgi:hypothetical protein